jgi:tetratricopeptide (TPR) repeat protein
MVNGKTLPAGTYAILSIPQQDDWTLIFNKDMTVTEQSYKQEADALRVQVKPTSGGEKIETFTIGFSDVTDSTAKMNIMWAGVKATADLAVNTSANAAANVDKAVADKPEDPAVLQAAASYNLSKGRNLEQALGWIDKSVTMKETYRNLFVKSQILGKMGKFAEAVPVAQKALTMGQSSNDPSFPFFKEGIEKSIAEYTTKMPAMPAAKGKKGKKNV